MLKQRLITGSILALLAIFAILFSSVKIFIALISLLFLFAAWEWGKLIKLPNYFSRGLFLFATAAIAWLVLISWHEIIWLTITIAWWIIAFVLEIIYPAVSRWWSNKLSLVVMGWLTIVPAWLAMINIRLLAHGQNWIILLLAMIWATDIGAYFSGKYFGKRKLLPEVSPGKTLAGFYGGISSALLVGIVGALCCNFYTGTLLRMLALALIVGLFSVVGDLFESMLKRQSGYKDIAGYLPGHGGLLDRIDSLFAGAPAFLWCFIVFM